jgi:hypothetical protein
MDNVQTAWPPRVGDRIQLVSTGAPGQVMEIKGSGGNLQFLVGVYSRELGKVTTAPHRTFMLREIAPGSEAPLAPAQAPTPTPRRARSLPAA